MNGAEKDLCNILRYGKRMYEVGCGQEVPEWPTTFYKATNLLQDIGYVPPIKQFTCLNEHHPTMTFNYDSSELECPVCFQVLEIPVYYSSIASKMKLWCKNKDMCRKMTKHWKQKDHWIRANKNEPYFPIKEAWDGTRFAEMSWFWNPDEEWTVPAICHSCEALITALEITTALIENGKRKVTCTGCGITEHIEEIKATGDPRNLAFLIHWDGFQPFGEPGHHSTGS